MTLTTPSTLERARSISFALLVLLSLVGVVFNTLDNPTGNGLVCVSQENNIIILLTVGFWILAITASLGALSAAYQHIGPSETYKRVLLWTLYLASVPALLLLPSDASLSTVSSICANGHFFTYLSWYIMSLIAMAAFLCIHLLIHTLPHHTKRHDDTTLSNTTGVEVNYKQQSAEELVNTIKQLRTPLSDLRVQITNLQTQVSKKSESDHQLALDTLHQSATSMATSLETHLEIAKIEAGQFDLSVTDCNLAQTVETICDELRPEVLKKSLVLLMRTNHSSQAIVKADRAKLQLIIKTLIRRAQQQTSKGTITAFVRDDLGAKKIYVDIIDSGVGMDSSAISTVFQKPTHNHEVNDQTNSLRLYIAYKLADAMHGDITAHSAGEGKGSRFTLSLPLEM